MILVIDAGNTHTVLGLFDGPALKAHWRLFTGNYRTDDELRIQVNMLLHFEGVDPETITGCCYSSVVPPLDAALNGLCRNGFGVEPVVVGPGVKTGLVIQVDNPKEVGADRIVNAVGAREKYEGPLIVVDFGTATTFDAISAAGEYRGGCIVPGIQISSSALFEKCAKLPRVDITQPQKHVIGKDTVAHIRAGLTFGYADLTDGLIRRMANELGGDPAVVATGGFAPLIADIATGIHHVEPVLTLNGLRAIHGKNR